MVWKAPKQKIANGTLGCQICLSDQVKASLFLNLKPWPPFIQDRRRTAGCGAGRFQAVSQVLLH
jgi:hypothetical protein